MFTFEEYLTGWLVYMGLIIGVLAVFWWLTRFIKWVSVKHSLRLIVSAILLVPVPVPDTANFWAPAWIVGALELIFSGLENFIPIGQRLLVAVAMALVIYALLTLLWVFIKRRKASPESS